jgi:hypothetical protein
LLLRAFLLSAALPILTPELFLKFMSPFCIEIQQEENKEETEEKQEENRIWGRNGSKYKSRPHRWIMPLDSIQSKCAILLSFTLPDPEQE